MIGCANPKEQYLSYKNEINQAISNVLESGRYILGEEVASFEKEFASFVGVKYSIGVASGTDAIFLSLKALDIGIGDEVITTSHTAIATISAIESTGAKAIFVDIEDEYFNIDTNQIKDYITPKTKAIVAVHLYGHPCDMDELVEISSKNNLSLLEDCAQANGAKYKNKDVGSIGKVGCFSFFPTKNLGALGDGGAITTNSKDIYQKLMMLRQYGWDKHRKSQLQGYNSRLDEIQASILRVKLRYLRSDIKKRNEIANLYFINIQTSNKCILPKVKKEHSHAYHLFVVKVNKRDELIKFLDENNIQTMIHYKQAVHMEKPYNVSNSLKYTEKIIDDILSLPMYPELSKANVLKVCTAINKFNEKN